MHARSRGGAVVRAAQRARRTTHAAARTHHHRPTIASVEFRSRRDYQVDDEATIEAAATRAGVGLTRRYAGNRAAYVYYEEPTKLRPSA